MIRNLAPFQAATCRSSEILGSGAESTSVGSGVPEQDEGRETSAVLVHRAHYRQRAHQGQMGRHSEKQRDAQEQVCGEGIPPRV